MLNDDRLSTIERLLAIKESLLEKNELERSRLLYECSALRDAMSIIAYYTNKERVSKHNGHIMS